MINKERETKQILRLYKGHALQEGRGCKVRLTTK